MEPKELISKEYALLCQRLGHMLSNKEKIEKEMQEIQSRIQALDKASEIISQAQKTGASNVQPE